jgi:hypothetical protein
MEHPGECKVHGFSICGLERPNPKTLASHVEEFLPLQQLATGYRQISIKHK